MQRLNRLHYMDGLSALFLIFFTVTSCNTSKKGDKGVDNPSKWPTCEQVETQSSLFDMAAEFDRVAAGRHLAPDGLLRNVYLTQDLKAVEHWKQHPNVVLWTGMYLASQAFRYAVTGDKQAQENAKKVVSGLEDATRVTGIEGLYCRSFSKPGVNYDYDGKGADHWVESTAPGYEGWRWNDDASKDGYDGMMFGYAAALEHFDDPGLLAQVRKLVTQVARYLVENKLQVIDHTGEPTEHGRLYQSAWDDAPGFNAMLAASWIKVAAEAGEDPGLDDFYYRCLMGKGGDTSDCPLPKGDLNTGTYIHSMEKTLLLWWVDCKENYDNFDMCFQAMYPLLRREKDTELRNRLQDVLFKGMFYTDKSKYQSIHEIGNSFFNFIFVALSGRGPDDPLAYKAVEDGICKLKQFPPVKYDRPIPKGTQEEICKNRLGDPVAENTIPLSEYYFDNYLWRLDFFEIQKGRQGDRRMVYSPEDFLVAYWLGRYSGLIGPDL
ncbi:MAG: hypothetical protein GXP49_14550 [Deltaproteobacteria bacterium]|nr:hypothetical protein [Deltaproteobacteria bacterium]